MRDRYIRETPLYVPARHAANVTGIGELMIIEAATRFPGIDDVPDVRSRIVDGIVYVNLADCLGIANGPGRARPD